MHEAVVACSMRPAQMSWHFCMQTPHSQSFLRNPNNRCHTFGVRVKFAMT